MQQESDQLLTCFWRDSDRTTSTRVHFHFPEKWHFLPTLNTIDVIWIYSYNWIENHPTCERKYAHSENIYKSINVICSVQCDKLNRIEICFERIVKSIQGSSLNMLSNKKELRSHWTSTKIPEIIHGDAREVYIMLLHVMENIYC